MAQPEVFFIKMSMDEQNTLIQKKVKHLFNQAGLKSVVGKQDLTAIKVHFGEKGNSTYVPAYAVEPVIRQVKSQGAKPFLAETNVLYKSNRDNVVDHMMLAYEHGFTPEATGAPVVIADGINGSNEIEIEINAPMNKKVALATEFLSANSIIVVSHATGHLGTGLGATLKNMGMGMASRKGKLTQHSVSKPAIRASKCTACGVCSDWCPVDAIDVDDVAEINQDICIGCGECIAACRFDAVGFSWDSSSEQLQKQIVEHALGIAIHKKNKIGYMLFLANMTKDCDCLAQKPHRMLDDIGVIAGFDPVALDQAAIDLTRENAGKHLAQLSYPNLDAEIQLEYAEKVGLGSRDYKLVEITL